MRSKPIFNLVLLPGLALGFIAASGCTATKMVDTWKEPSYTAGPLKKIMVIGLAHDPGTKRMFEDIFSGDLKAKGVDAVPSYTLFGDEEITKDVVKDKVREGGYDGVILTRLVGKDEKTTYVPGSAYSVGFYGGPYWGAYSYGYGMAYSPGYVTTEQIFRVQTALWSTQGEGGKMIWTGTSETVDPSSAKSTCDEISKLVVWDLVQAKLIGG